MAEAPTPAQSDRDPAAARPIDVGFALTADVITGAGLSRAPRALSFFAESTCPSLDVARRADFIEYFLETSKASINTVVRGVRIAFSDGILTDVEGLVAALGERAIHILSVEPVETTLQRSVECNMPEDAAGWSPAVRRRARAAVATACAPGGHPQDDAAPPDQLPATEATEASETARASSASRAAPDGSDKATPGIPRLRRSERPKPPPGTPDVPEVSPEVTSVDPDLDGVIGRLQERNRELADAQETILHRNNAIAELQQELAAAKAEIVELNQDVTDASDASEATLLRRRLESTCADLLRMDAELTQERYRAGTTALELSMIEQRCGDLKRFSEVMAEAMEPAQRYLDEMALELNTSLSARALAEEHVHRLEGELRTHQGRAQRHQREMAEVRQSAQRMELAAVDRRAASAGRVEAAQALARQSSDAVYFELDDLVGRVEALQEANHGLRDELGFERSETHNLQAQLLEMAERLASVRSQVTRLPRLTPRLDSSTPVTHEPATLEPATPAPMSDVVADDALEQELLEAVQEPSVS